MGVMVSRRPDWRRGPWYTAGMKLAPEDPRGMLYKVGLPYSDIATRQPRMNFEYWWVDPQEIHEFYKNTSMCGLIDTLDVRHRFHTNYELYYDEREGVLRLKPTNRQKTDPTLDQFMGARDAV